MLNLYTGIQIMILIQPINFHSTLNYIILSWVLRFPLPVYHYKHNLIINSNPHYLNHTDADINHKTCIQPEALKSLYRSPGYKKNQLVLC